MLLTIKQFSTEFKIPLYTLYQHIEDGLLPADKYGSTYLIDSDKAAEYKRNVEQREKEKEIVGGRPSKVFFGNLEKETK